MVIKTDYTEWSVLSSKLMIQSGLCGHQNTQYRVVCVILQTAYTEWSVRPSKQLYVDIQIDYIEWSVGQSKLCIQNGMCGHQNCLYRVVREVVQTAYTEWSVWSSKLPIQSGLFGHPN